MRTNYIVSSSTGRGTVVSGRVERGKVKKNEEVELVGHGRKMKTVVTGTVNNVLYLLIVHWPFIKQLMPQILTMVSGKVHK